MLHEKELELVNKSDSLERERKSVSDLEKGFQNKQFEMERLLQNERNTSKTRIDDQKTKLDKSEREYFRLED